MKFSTKRKNKYQQRFFVFSIVLVAFTAAFAESDGLSARGVFERLHIPAFETLKKTTRLDLLDYWDADSVFHAKNAVGADTWIEELSPDYMRLRLTPVSTCQIKLLPLASDTIVMTIFTVETQKGVADSDVSFFNRRLQALEGGKFLIKPTIEDFYTRNKKTLENLNKISGIVKFDAVSVSATSANNDIVAKLTISPLLDEESSAKVENLFLPEIGMTWKNGMFRLAKHK